jgi:hypothetical protein
MELLCSTCTNFEATSIGLYAVDNEPLLQLALSLNDRVVYIDTYGVLTLNAVRNVSRDSKEKCLSNLITKPSRLNPKWLSSMQVIMVLSQKK